MGALEATRWRPADVRAARVTLAKLLIKTRRPTTELVGELIETAGVSRRTAFRVLAQARQDQGVAA